MKLLKTKKHHLSRTTTFSLVLFFAFSLVSCKDNKDTKNPFFDDFDVSSQILFYSSQCYDNNEKSVKVNFNNLYVSFKNSDDTFLDSFSNNCFEMNLQAEDFYLCYYVKNDVYDNIQRLIDKKEVKTSYRPIFQFCDIYRESLKSIEFINENVNVLSVDTNNPICKRTINNFCFLDAARFYIDKENCYLKVIDFPEYSFEGDTITIFDSKKKEKRNFLFSHFNYLPKNKDEYYVLLDNIIYNGIEFEPENGINIVKDYFDYAINKDEHFYDDINSCIISKTFIKMTNAYERYSAIFDYQKTKKLLGLGEIT